MYKLIQDGVVVLETSTIPEVKADGLLIDGTLYVGQFEIVSPNTISPVEFKMCFTSIERVAIKDSRATDPIINDAYELLDDPRLQYVNLDLQSTKDLIDYMVTANLITAERAVDIKLGKFV